MFIGREKELLKLHSSLKNETPTFVPIIGRRGVGKTFLLNRFCDEIKEKLINDEIRNVKIFKIKGYKSVALKQQLKSFILNCDSFFSNIEEKEIFKKNSWEFLFNKLLEKFNEEQEKEKRKLIFIIDEFAWLNTKQSNFINSFSAFWNEVASLKNIHFYVTASAVAWMDKHVINTVGGLHGRATDQIKLKPFSFLDTVKFLHKKNNHFSLTEYLNYYFFTGGVPRYLNRINPLNNISENGVLVFSNESNVGMNEFEEFFTSSFDSKNHQKIIESFYNKNKMTAQEIIKKTKLSKTTVYNCLNDLVVSNVLTLKKNYKKENDGYYYLTDLFCFSFLKILKEEINLKNFENHRTSIINSFAFEILTLLNIDMIKDEISLGGLETIETQWQNKYAQINILLDYLNSKYYSIIECKNKNDIFVITKEYEKELINKKNAFDENGKYYIDFILFTLYGSKSNNKNFIFKDVSLEKIVKKFIKNIE